MLTAVLPFMNRASVLHETVLSLLKQTQPPDEILISALRDVLDARATCPGCASLQGQKVQHSSGIPPSGTCTPVAPWSASLTMTSSYILNIWSIAGPSWRSAPRWPECRGDRWRMEWLPSVRVAARSITGNALDSLMARGISKSEHRQRLRGNALGLRGLLLRGPQTESIRLIG